MDIESLLLIVGSYKIIVVLSLLAIEQVAYLLPVSLIYEKGIVVGRYKISETPTLFTHRKIDGLKIVFEGERIFVRLSMLPGSVLGFFPTPFVGYVKGQRDGYVYIKIGPITFVLAIFFVLQQLYTYGSQGLGLVFTVLFVALPFYVYLVVTFIHVIEKRGEWE